MAFASRIEGNVERPERALFSVDGAPVEGFPGESVAGALLAAGILRLRTSPRSGDDRGAFCMMGVCQECLVHVDGRVVTACLEPVRAGMDVRLGGWK